MKKVLFILLILMIMFGGYLLYDNLIANRIPKLTTEEEVVNLDEIIVYGTHLSLHGTSVNDENLDLVLYNGDFLAYDINIDDNEFNVSNLLNEGIDLEKIPVGTYCAFLRSSTKDDNDKDVYRYYIIKNNTEYKETEYYTFSNVRNKILISTDDYYETMMFDVSENKEKDVYDVVIDPGHGGMDSGASKNGTREADYTMKIAMNLKKKLEAKGVTVKLTREEDQLSSNETLPDYGTHGRAVISHEVHAKYVFSIHLNSNSYASVHGIEIYTPDNINYDFANSLASNVVSMADTAYSTNRVNRVSNGIYTRTFTESDIADSLAEYEKKNLKAYEMTTKSNYYFMIRETGGIMTGAYVDDRNAPKRLGNPYYKSNIGSETYLLELAYLTNTSDIENITNNMDKYTDAIVKSFMPIFNGE